MRVSVRRATTVLMQTCHYASEQKKLGTKQDKTWQKWQKSQVPHKNQIFLFGQDNKMCRMFDFSISKLWGHFSSLQNGRSKSTAILDFYFIPGVLSELCH